MAPPPPGRQGWSRAAAAVLAASVAAATGCSHVDHRWQLPGYLASDAGAVKRVVVRGIADPSWAPGLAATLAMMASDYAKLRRNYIVLAPEAAGAQVPAGTAACQAPAGGLLVLEALDAERQGGRLALRLRAELWACRGHRPVWHAEGHRRLRADDPHLEGLTASYKTALGEPAAPWAAAVFVLGQEILDSLPDPRLTEAEVDEKIEAG